VSKFAIYKPGQGLFVRWGTVADTVPAEEMAAVMARGTATAAPDK